MALASEITESMCTTPAISMSSTSLCAVAIAEEGLAGSQRTSWSPASEPTGSVVRSHRWRQWRSLWSGRAVVVMVVPGRSYNGRRTDIGIGIGTDRVVEDGELAEAAWRPT